MVTISVKSDLKKATRFLGKHRKQIPFAAARALTQTAKRVEQVEKRVMRRVFNKPTRYTLNAQFVSPATKRNLSARVWLIGSNRKRDRHYLEPHIYGGDRDETGFERQLVRRGILAAGWKAIPGDAMPKNSRGGLTRGTYQKVLAQLGAFEDRHQNATASTRSRRNRRHLSFYVDRRRSFYGIMARQGKRVFPAFIFVRATRYRRRFNFFGVASRVSSKAWPRIFNRSLNNAIRTAR